MFLKYSSIVFFGIFATFSLTAQDQEVRYYNEAGKDSLHLYFNDLYVFVEEACADFIRQIKVDTNGRYHGPFVDIKVGGELRAKGAYSHGSKNGRFYFYYPDGTIQRRGIYRRNKLFGRWEFFKPDGRLDAVWSFEKSIPLLVTKINDQGEEIISNGNGHFTGQGFRDYYGEDDYQMEGEVVDGLRQGTWKVKKDDRVYCEEDFVDGSFVIGRLTLLKSADEYTDGPDVHILKPDYMELLERLNTRSCPINYREQASANITFNYNDLRTELLNAMDGRIRRPRGTEGMSFAEEIISVRFEVDKQGQASDFKLASVRGSNYFNSIRRVLNTKTYPPRNGFMYLHMKLTYGGGDMYSMQYILSPLKEHRFN